MSRDRADPPGGARDPFELNIASLLAHYASIPGGERLDTPELRISTTNLASRTLNAASVAHVDARRPRLRRAIATTLGVFAQRGQPWRWIVGSTSRPAGLEESLLAEGLLLGAEAATMRLELDAPLAEPGGPTGLEIREVETAAAFDAWIEVQRRSLELSGAAGDAWETVHRALGWGRDLPLRNYVGYLDGQPVGSAALYLGGSDGGPRVAGIYNVGTVPEARGRGVGRSMTLAALRDGQAVGHRVASLGSSAMGLPVYRRLGFEQVGLLRWYTTPEWH